jgi:hypothetical protein
MSKARATVSGERQQHGADVGVQRRAVPDGAGTRDLVRSKGLRRRVCLRALLRSEKSRALLRDDGPQSQEIADPLREIIQRGGLGQERVAERGDARRPVPLARMARDHDDGRGRVPVGAQAGGQRPAVAPRHVDVDVEHEEVGRLVGQHLLGLGGVEGGAHGEADGAEELLDQIEMVAVVVDQNDRPTRAGIATSGQARGTLGGRHLVEAGGQDGRQVDLAGIDLQAAGLDPGDVQQPSIRPARCSKERPIIPIA